MPIRDKEKAKAYFKERLEKKKAYLNQLKDKPCSDCGRTYPTYVMEFDHVPEKGKKKFTVAKGGNWSLTKGALIDELAKCDVVCSNCHSIRTYNRLHSS